VNKDQLLCSAINYKTIMKKIFTLFLVFISFTSFAKDDQYQTVKSIFQVNPGIFAPTGELALTGDHLACQFLFGLRVHRVGVAFSLQAETQFSPNYYDAFERGVWYHTNSSPAGYIGGEVQYSLHQFQKGLLIVEGGMGRHEIVLKNQVSTFGKLDYVRGEYLRTLDSNIGVEYDVSTVGLVYWGFKARYSFLDFDTHGGTNLSGNAAFLGLVFGLQNYNAHHLRFSSRL